MEAVQKQKKLEELVRLRIDAFRYMNSVHKGEKMWMDCVDLKKSVGISTIYDKWPGHEKQIQKWFTLGTSLGELLDCNFNAQEFVQQVAQLLFEFNHYYSSSTKQSLKLLMAKDMGHFPEMQQNLYLEEQADATRVALYKTGGQVVYTRLKAPDSINTFTEMDSLFTDNLAINEVSMINTSGRTVSRNALDEFEVVFSLCTILEQMYLKYLDIECIGLLESILRIDSEIQQIVLDPYAKEFNRAAMVVIRTELKEPAD